MVEQTDDPTRGRDKKNRRKRSEIAVERAANYDPTSEWVDIYGASIHLGFGVQGYERVRHRQDDRELPPARRNPRGWEWKRSDLSAMKEMERLGLWKEWWQDLRKAKGEHAAWTAMLGLLAEEKARLKAEADEALRIVREERARAKAAIPGGPF